MDQALEKFGTRSLGRGSTLRSTADGAQRTAPGSTTAEGGEEATGDAGRADPRRS